MRPPASDVSPEPRKAICPRAMIVSNGGFQLSLGRGVEFIYYMQEFLIGWDIRHGSTVMCEADITLGIDDTIYRHTSQLEEIHFLPVLSGHRMVGVWQTNKRNVLFRPILLKRCGYIGPYSQNFDPSTCKLFVFISQARQLRAAVRSHKAAQEGKNHRLALKIR